MKAFLLAALVSSAALATTLVKADLGWLARNSDAVVVGKVVSVKSRFTSDHMRIMTDTEIAVSQSLKGTTASTVVVMQPGGEVGDVGQLVAGVARFTADEEVVVFLEKRGERYFVTGLGQGKYTLEKSADGKKYALPMRGLDAELVDPVTHQPVPAETSPILFETLVQQVVTAAGQTAPQQSVGPKTLEKRP